MNLTSFENVNFTLSDKLKATASQLLWWLHTYSRADKPILSRVLESQFHVAGPEIRAMVDYLILVERKPIGSGGKGYFLARNRDEIVTSIAHREQRGIKNLTVASALKEIFPVEAQESLRL
jgi:hypothetical protein